MLKRIQKDEMFCLHALRLFKLVKQNIAYNQYS